jgi:hypothetical protein
MQKGFWGKILTAIFVIFGTEKLSVSKNLVAAKIVSKSFVPEGGKDDFSAIAVRRSLWWWAFQFSWSCTSSLRSTASGTGQT